MLAKNFGWQASEPNHETAQHLPATISCKLCVRTLEDPAQDLRTFHLTVSNHWDSHRPRLASAVRLGVPVTRARRFVSILRNAS